MIPVFESPTWSSTATQARSRRLATGSADIAREFCDELNGRLRVELPQLLPSPSESLDEAVSQWIAQAEDISFECARDQTVLRRRLATLETLAAEIAGGLETLND